MKRLIISLLCFGAVIGISFFGIRFVNRTYGELSDLLDEAETLAQAEDFSAAKEVCERAERLYSKSEKMLSAFVNRGDLNEVGVSVSALSPLSTSDSSAEFLSALSQAKISITHLKNDQSPSGQIFF